MSGLLYTTSAGAVDFYVTASVLAFGALTGGVKTRSLCALIVAGFFMQRAALVMFPESPAYHAVWLCVWFLGLMAIALRIGDGKMVKSFSAIYVICIAASLLWLNGVIDFWDAANSLTVALYLQLFLIIGGGVHDGFLSMGDKPNGSGRLDAIGRRLGLSSVLEKHKAE